MKNEFDPVHGEQLDIDRANDVSPIDAAMQHSTLKPQSWADEQTARMDKEAEAAGITKDTPPDKVWKYWAGKRDEACARYKQLERELELSLAPHQIEPCGGLHPGTVTVASEVTLDPTDHTPALTGQMPAEEQFPALQRKPVKRLFPDWFYGNTEAANKLAKEQCGIPRDRDFVDPETMRPEKPTPTGRRYKSVEELIADSPVLSEIDGRNERNDSTFALTGEGTEGDRIRESLSRQHCPQCEPRLGGTKPAYHPECFRITRDNTVFKQILIVIVAFVVAGGMVGLAWLMLR